MQKEERSKVTAGTRYENNKRDLEQSLKTRQGGIQARLRQGRSTTNVSGSKKMCYMFFPHPLPQRAVTSLMSVRDYSTTLRTSGTPLRRRG